MNHCSGFPDECLNRITVDPDPPQHYGGVRCGCGDKESDTVSESPEIHVNVTEYEVSIFPEGHWARRHLSIHVRYQKNSQLWTVMDGPIFYSRFGTLDTDYRCEDREEWLDRYHFTFDEAMKLAARVAPEISANGRSALDVWKEEA